MTTTVISFGPFRLLPYQRMLLEGDRPVRLGGRAFDILTILVEHAGEVVEKNSLLSRVWPDTFVDEASLRIHISSLRKILGDGGDRNRFITNIPGRGYSFVSVVHVAQQPDTWSNSEENNISRNNAPTPICRVIGRDAVTVDLVAQLPLKRLITIVGVGGIGKTTLALSATERLAKNYPGGTCFVDLAPVEGGQRVPQALASALGLSVTSGDPVRVLTNFLREKSVLIVLDNCEHVVEASAELAETILRAAPLVHILATSREPLKTDGETLLHLGSLEVPPDGCQLTADDALAYSAVQLFVERATASLDTFMLTNENAPIVSEVCRRLDGIALAIELAASQTFVLGLRGLSERFSDRLSLQIKGRRTSAARHQTLQAMLDWSVDTLSDRDKIVFSRLSVFKTPFRLAWAVALASSPNDRDWDVTESVSELVAKSLISSDVSEDVPQFRLFEIARAYGLDLLTRNNEINEMFRRHSMLFLDMLRASGLDRSGSVVIKAWAGKHPNVIDEVRSALDWANSEVGDESIAVALTAAASPLFIHQFLMEECRERVQAVLPKLTRSIAYDPRIDLQLHVALGVALQHTRPFDLEFERTWSRAAEVAEQLQDSDYRLRTLWGLWLVKHLTGDFPGALQVAERFMNLPRDSVAPADILVGERILGVTLHILGDQRAARNHIEYMIAHYNAPSDGIHIAKYQFDQTIAAKSFRSQILWLLGYPDQAVDSVICAVDEAAAINHLGTLYYVLILSACGVTLLAGRYDLTRRYIARLRSFSSDAHGPWNLWRKCYEGALLIVGGDVLEGAKLLRAGLAGMPGQGFMQWHIAFLGYLAQAEAIAGDLTKAFETLSAALAESQRNENRWCVAELLRIKGELLLIQGHPEAAQLAETQFRDSLEWARRQGAISWELRTATDLANLLIDQRRTDEARRLLRGIYDKFDEGFETPCLTAARTLLVRLDAAAGI